MSATKAPRDEHAPNAERAPRPTGRRWRLLHYERPWSINTERTWNPFKRSAIVKEWRGDWRILAMTEPDLVAGHDQIRVEATPIRPERASGHPGDVGNCYPAIKAAIDGIVDAGMCVDDGPTHVIEIAMFAPIKRGKYHGLELVLEEVLP